MLSKIKHKVSEGGRKIKEKVGSGLGATVLQIVGVIILLAVFFVLGNLFGEKIAMPIVRTVSKVNLSFSKKVVAPRPGQTQPAGQAAAPGGITPPTPNATEEEKIKFSEAIRLSGVETGIITVSEGCAFNPFVTRVKQGEKIAFKNDGSKETTVAIHKDLLTIPAGNSKTLDTNSVNMGIYGLVCGNNIGVGYLEVTP